jgi:hypothetical protein
VSRSKGSIRMRAGQSTTFLSHRLLFGGGGDFKAESL